VRFSVYFKLKNANLNARWSVATDRCVVLRAKP